MTATDEQIRWNSQPARVNFYTPVSAVAREGVLSKADLERPVCHTCFRPIKVPTSRSYCADCEDSGAALRHASHPHRRMVV